MYGKFLQWGAKAATSLLSNPESQEKIIKLGKNCVDVLFKSINRNNEQLKQFEKEAAKMCQQGDSIQDSVHANWQGIKKFNSEEEYFQEEERIAAELERALIQKTGQKRIEGE